MKNNSYCFMMQDNMQMISPSTREV